MHRSAKQIIAIIFVLVLVISCSSPKTYTIVEQDGYKLITNTAPQFKTSPVSIEFVQQWGNTESSAGKGTIGQPMSVTLDDDNNMYILDGSTSEIIKFSPAGEEILRFAGAGQGPGELTHPYQLMHIAGKIYIHDMERGMQIFKTNGEFIRQFNVPIAMSMANMVAEDTVMAHILAAKAAQGDNNLIHFYNAGGDALRSFCQPTPVQHQDATNRYNMFKAVQDLDGNVVATFLTHNRIEKYDPAGKVIFKMKRNTGIQEFIRDTGKDPDYGFTIWQTSYVTRSLQTDSQNRIWLISFKGQPDFTKEYSVKDLSDLYKFEIFDKDGIHLANLDFPEESFDTFRIIGDRMFFIDPRENAVVREYKIVTK